NTASIRSTPPASAMPSRPGLGVGRKSPRSVISHDLASRWAATGDRRDYNSSQPAKLPMTNSLNGVHKPVLWRHEATQPSMRLMVGINVIILCPAGTRLDSANPEPGIQHMNRLGEVAVSDPSIATAPLPHSEPAVPGKPLTNSW